MKDQRREQKPGPEKRIRMSEDLIWGVHPVLEALLQEPERVLEIILHRERRSGKLDEIIGIAKAKGIRTTFVQSLRLTGEGAAEVRHQGVLARTSQTALLSFDEVVERFAERVQNGEMPRLVACDSLQDPHNIGAIIRSALASGAVGVILTRERSAPLSGTAVKASAGAVSHIDICQVTNLVAALKKIKEAGAWVFGAVKDTAAQSLYATDFRLPACVVVGSEGEGIRPLVRRECDILISIPMAGSLDSLNSSVAAAVILFEAMRQNTGSS